MKQIRWSFTNILIATMLVGCQRLEPAPPTFVTDPVKEAQELLDYHHSTAVKEIKIILRYNEDVTKSEMEELYKTAKAMGSEVELEYGKEGMGWTVFLIHRREKLEKKDLEKVIADAIALAKRTRAGCHLVYKEPRESR